MQTLTPADVSERLAVAGQLIRQAGALAQGYFRDPSRQAATRKGAHDWVTAADRAVEDLLRGALLEAFPGDQFLGEESGASAERSGQPLWVVDPIDGTQEFARGSRNWCITIALVHHQQVQLGLVFDPTSDEFYSATRGGGATLNGQAMKVSNATDLADGVVTIEFSTNTPAVDVIATMSRLFERGGTFQRGGSGSYLPYFLFHIHSYLVQAINPVDKYNMIYTLTKG
ncbi:MAG: inositol monophosphatase family protein [Actinomycetales bacterium]